MTGYVINSAALFFRSEAPARVPQFWLSRAIDFFAAQGLTLDFFDVAGEQELSEDETHDFANKRDSLTKAVKEGLVDRVGLYSKRHVKAALSEWQALVSVEMKLGMMFVGIDESKLFESALILKSAYKVGDGLLGVKYGISYKLDQARGPEAYAAGVSQGSSLTDIADWLSRKEPDRDPLTAWRDEKYGQRRYLTGLFRGAYPASIICREHMDRIQKCSGGEPLPGSFVKLVENELWIWELNASELIVAERLLEDASLLIG